MLDRSRTASLCCLLFAVLALLGCGQRPGPLARAEPQTGSGQLQAGAAKLDITPLPGVPLGGHSVEGGTGYAVWTRLWARSIYLEDADGEPLVLVVADLWSIPAGLPDAVVERVREHHGLRHIARHNLSLSATHTHHSPANFASNRLYNRAAANRMGFDPELFEFFVDRIAAAVAESARARAPARLRLNSATLPLVARNRSIAPFAQNAEAELIAAHNAALPTCPGAPIDPNIALDPCQAIDPTLTTLRIEDLDGQVRAIAAFFAVHATSMINATDAYNGDLFAVATARAEAALARTRPEQAEPVVALFNGAEGDVSPHWATQGRADALTVGARLGDGIIDSALTQPRGRLIEGAIDNSLIRTPLADQPVSGPPQARTAKRALAGKALLGGAEDGRTRWHARLPEGQIVKRSRRAGHGPKKPAVPPALFSLVFPRFTHPQEAPLALHRIGPLIFVGLPGEFTTVMGMRVRQAIAASAPADAPRPITIGLADEYLGYFVTPEEYALQHYEGASTMWGQYAGTLIAERYGALASTVIVETELSARSDPGAPHRFALEPGSRANRALRRLDERLREQLAIDTALDRLVRLELDTLPPAYDTATWPEIRVERRDGERWTTLQRGDGTRVDERGTEFVMFPVDIGRARWRWAIWWIGDAPEGQSLRLHAFGPDGSEHCSIAFEAGDVPPADAVPCQDHDAAPVADTIRGIGGDPSPRRGE